MRPSMTKAEKVNFIVQKLEELYPVVPVPLDHYSPYTLLVAVLLSAQCTDERVNKTTPELFALADNAHDMANIPVEQIKEIIRPCGLSPMKSKGISGLSKILVEKYSGEVPADMEALEQLPAVGHKTASVVMAQAFGVPSFPVDTHIHRLIYRWGLFKTARACNKQNKIANEFLTRPSGINCIFKSFILEGSIVRRGDTTLMTAQYAPKQVEHLFSKILI